jgi:HPt (histidine-containing phosphotransfer) domain-containing protein
VPVIALSASVLSSDRRAALEAGMDAFASKPVDMIELSFEIARIMGLAPAEEARPRRVAPGAALLNATQGLSRWGGQHEPYLRALRHFTAEYAKLPTLLSSHSAFGGAAEARALAHRVKGTAANLGLEALATLLDEFERQVVAEAAELVPPLLARMRHLLYDTFAAIDLELAKSPTSSGVGRPLHEFDLAQVRSLIDQISHGFGSGQFDGSAFTRLLAALGGYVEETRLDELQRIVDEFDFELAAERMRELAAEFELPQVAAQA